jgi:hypothetical protein
LLAAGASGQLPKKAICIRGNRVDEQMEQMEAKEFDVLCQWFESIKSFGLPAGIATRRARTNLLAEQKGLPTDFAAGTRLGRLVMAGTSPTKRTRSMKSLQLSQYSVTSPRF